ncbi:MAG: hypothetical protein PHR35_02790 [Kiritimatiellae bacterium]|nr:hypothetical protein [Kiritimatiellia bacterium]
MTQTWREASSWLVGWYLLMPDHMHFFCSPNGFEPPSVKRWVGYWKRMVGETEPDLHCIFQEDCWDTQMRTRENYEEKLSYTRMNPVRAGLVKTSDEWAFQGKVYDVSWR